MESNIIQATLKVPSMCTHVTVMLTNKTKSHELKDLAPEDQHVVIKAVDKTKDKHTQLLNLKPSENKAETGGLVRELHLAVGAK